MHFGKKSQKENAPVVSRTGDQQWYLKSAHEATRWRTSSGLLVEFYNKPRSGFSTHQRGKESWTFYKVTPDGNVIRVDGSKEHQLSPDEMRTLRAELTR